ncbi:DUF1616 domain-containing protein [Haloarchaeobius litoreus]|uniref:DUF1616 domain-containing protein n=1 Tax=Haloarchaeobius litoreus TaxID=755306 RepID=A0ABD6DNC0_9EURY
MASGTLQASPWMATDRTHVEAVLLATSLFLLLATASAIALVQPVGPDRPTELALVDDQGTAAGYPTELAVGEEGRTVVQITNNVDESRRYTVVTTLDGRTVSSGTVTVDAGSQRRFPVSITPEGPPGRQRFLVRLWTGDETTGQPDLSVRIWVNVTESSD